MVKAHVIIHCIMVTVHVTDRSTCYCIITKGHIFLYTSHRLLYNGHSTLYNGHNIGHIQVFTCAKGHTTRFTKYWIMDTHQYMKGHRLPIMFICHVSVKLDVYLSYLLAFQQCASGKNIIGQNYNTYQYKIWTFY